MKYFHELTDQEYEDLDLDKRVTDFDQPNWCQYPGALNGVLGCWSLVFNRKSISEDFCKNCECFKPNI